MSSKVAKLISAYRQHLTVPWQPGLAAIQRVIFAVYDKTDELRLRANVEEFALATQQSGKQWLLLDVTNAFPAICITNSQQKTCCSIFILCCWPICINRFICNKILFRLYIQEQKF